jgi:hypothetical protein
MITKNIKPVPGFARVAEAWCGDGIRLYSARVFYRVKKAVQHG